MTNFILDEGTIAYEDDYLLIIDKPAGMLVHPTVNEWGCTLYDYVTEYYQRKGITANIHPVSRLDRHTSGLVIFAKEPIIQHWLSQQQMDKEYLAIVTGELPNDEGIIEAPIARKEGSIIERCVSENGKYAKTSYKLLAKRKGLSLLQVKLFTGRTHQIRAHMAHIGHPLLGDGKYGVNREDAKIGYKFQALYARKLVFRFKDDEGALGYLKGREVTLPDDAIWFYNDFFTREKTSAPRPPAPRKQQMGTPKASFDAKPSQAKKAPHSQPNCKHFERNGNPSSRAYGKGRGKGGSK